MVLQNYQNFTEMTSNMIYIVAFGVGLKCPRKIHLNTQCTEVRFASLLSSGFITAIVVNLPEKKLGKRTSVHYPAIACTTIRWVLRLESPVGNE